jgi:hypothetical protein
MTEIDCETWEDFETKINELLPANHVSTLLFRGQKDSKWKLETTLERHCGDKYKKLEEFYLAIFNAKPEIETTYSDRKWSTPTPLEYKEWLTKKELLAGDPAIEYMIYLRHYGFPSPLLDWSRNKYVAAFFAFGDLPIIKTDFYVSIYAYIGFLSSCKGGIDINGPHIYERGLKDKSDLASLKRHNKQEPKYTICVVNDHNDKDVCYTCHEEVFMQNNNRRDILFKFNIPSSERHKVLKKLEDEHGINHYSLFGTEDSYIKTMAIRYIG